MELADSCLARGATGKAELLLRVSPGRERERRRDRRADARGGAKILLLIDCAQPMCVQKEIRARKALRKALYLFIPLASIKSKDMYK